MNDNTFEELLDKLAYPYKIGRHIGLELADGPIVTGDVCLYDEQTVIIKTTNNFDDEDLIPLLVPFETVKRVYPDFQDDNHDDSTTYLGMDITSKFSIFDREDGHIVHYQFADGMLIYTHHLEPQQLTMEQVKQEFLDEIHELALQTPNPDDEGTISIGLDPLGIDDMLKEHNLFDEHSPRAEYTDLEHSLNRSIYWLTSHDCAIITAYRQNASPASNRKNNSKLLKTLGQQGYGTIRTYGHYKGVGDEVGDEVSYIVFDLTENPEQFFIDMYELGQKYNQDCFLYKNKDNENAILVGTNENFGLGVHVDAGVFHMVEDANTDHTRIDHHRFTFSSH